MHASLPALALALALLPLSGPPQSTPPPTPKPPTRVRPMPESERIRAEVLGVWELVRTELAGRSYVGGDCKGYLTIVPEYASLIARLSEPIPGRPNLADMGFTAGTYRWNYDDSRLQFTLQTLLQGSDFDDPDGLVIYEAPGSRRDYEIIVAGNDLTLTRGQGQTRMFFQRLSRGIPPAPKDPAAPAGTGKPATGR